MHNIAAKYPHYYAVGNRKIFTDGDLDKIIEHLREEATQRRTARGGSEAAPLMPSDRALAKARELLKERKGKGRS